MIAKILLSALLLASTLLAQNAPQSTSLPSTAASAPQDNIAAAKSFAEEALRTAKAAGFIQVRDVKTGKVLFHVSSTGDTKEREIKPSSNIMPLSIIKVFVAALWIDHDYGNEHVNCATTQGRQPMLIDEVLTSGCDSAGAELANLLRRRISASSVMHELQRYGIHGLDMRPESPDGQWGYALSLGEDNIATPADISAFFQLIGDHGGKLMAPKTAERLLTALDGVVQHGTASSIKNVFANSPWSIAGKTGTGPGDCGNKCDGMFASVLSDDKGGRYVIVVYLRGKGAGGGIPAQTAASVGEYLAFGGARANAQAPGVELPTPPAGVAHQ